MFRKQKFTSAISSIGWNGQRDHEGGRAGGGGEGNSDSPPNDRSGRGCLVSGEGVSGFPLPLPSFWAGMLHVFSSIRLGFCGAGEGVWPRRACRGVCVCAVSPFPCPLPLPL